jgi:hypothetical protein
MRRSVALIVTLAACTEHGKGGGDPIDPNRPDPPADCAGHCIIDHPVESFEDCCDSVTCFFNEDTDEWEVTFCDAPPPVDPCAQCDSTQLCVQSYDGTCGESTACVPRTVECPNNACSAECEQTYCSSPFQCMNRAPCGTESPVSFTCYGP